MTGDIREFASPRVEPQSELRWTSCGDPPTGFQRDHARASGLYDHGDCILVWVNEGDFWSLQLGGRCKLVEYPAGRAPEPRGVSEPESEGGLIEAMAKAMHKHEWKGMPNPAFFEHRDYWLECARVALAAQRHWKRSQ